jgi:hypothetical protein
MTMPLGDEFSRQDPVLKSQNPVRAYKNGACPDCGEPLPEGVQDGDSCCNCGHVFHTERKDD